MKQKDYSFILIFSFLFPLMLIGWGLKDNFDDLEKKIQIEGLLFNIAFAFALIFLKYLSIIPLLGIVFAFFFSLVLWGYIISLITIIIFKTRNIEREIPFISFYAERLKEK